MEKNIVNFRCGKTQKTVLKDKRNTTISTLRLDALDVIKCNFTLATVASLRMNHPFNSLIVGLLYSDELQMKTMLMHFTTEKSSGMYSESE